MRARAQTGSAGLLKSRQAATETTFNEGPSMRRTPSLFEEISMKNQDYYQTLEVDRCATCSEIKQAYRTLAHRFHPDVSEDRDGERKFKDISEAYRTLKKSDSRIAYDRQIRNTCLDTKSGGPGFPAYASFNPVAFSLWRYWIWLWQMQGQRKQ
jgi:curved DNA-binding protein